MVRPIAICISLALIAGPAALAQPMQEIVVTAQRLSEYDPLKTPDVTLTKRADFLLTKVEVVCDTRDESQRRSELRTTLRNMIAAARKDSRIQLGTGDDIVGLFDEGTIEKVIAPDKKADTSRATVLIKTAVTPADTFDQATTRIRNFVERVPKVGRTEVLIDNDWELSIIGPNQYRMQIAKLVADDAKTTSGLFGAGYAVEVEGLQLPVSWYQSGPLDLALYIPYRLTIRPTVP